MHEACTQSMFCALMSVTKHWDPNPDTKLTRVQNQAGEGGEMQGLPWMPMSTKQLQGD